MVIIRKYEILAKFLKQSIMQEKYVLISYLYIKLISKFQIYFVKFF